VSYARGRGAEALAAAFLVERGLTLLSSNYRCRHGEIDLIGRDGATLCFIEVRARRGRAFGAPIETVSVEKRRRILKTAAHYLAYAFRGTPCACRFDLVTIQGQDSPTAEWWRGAFEAEATLYDPGLGLS
jgi:putative endonuclease